jgi:hypothetical protein
MSAQAVEMNVPERQHEPERKRKQRNARTTSHMRTKPMHAATSLVADTCSRRCRRQNFSYNVTFRQSVVRESAGLLQKNHGLRRGFAVPFGETMLPATALPGQHWMGKECLIIPAGAICRSAILGDARTGQVHRDSRWDFPAHKRLLHSPELTRYDRTRRRSRKPEQWS